MTREEFRQLIKSKIVMLDGATGSNLQQEGMPSGSCPETWILEHKDVLIHLQKSYLHAGSDILFAPTFTSNRIKLAEYGLDGQLKEINQKLVELSKLAVNEYKRESGSNRLTFVAGDITMTGAQLAPMGTMEFEELVDVYKEQAQALLDAGVDLFVVETMMSLQECRAALLAIKELCDLPVMVTLTFNADGKTLYGTKPETAVVVLQSLGADAVGVNCSTGPKKMCEVLERMKPYALVPLIAKPNAGLPLLIDGKTVFQMKADEFVTECEHFVELGISIYGGCCGTTPEYIERLSNRLQSIEPPAISQKATRVLTTERSVMEIDMDGKFVVIGERINPTGKKELQEALREGNLDLVCEMAVRQIEDGADILDINLGMNGIDEEQRMLLVIQELTQQVDVPLCIDSSHVKVIEAALRHYPGRALINSISLEKEKYEKLLPIAKKYGAMFILLPLSDAGLPKSLNEKQEIIRTIVSQALNLGLRKEDIIVDGLVNTIGANKEAALQTIATIRYCKEEMNLPTVVGLSNISFGLPQRQFVNSTFLAFAIQAGLTMAIANPSQDLLMNTAFAADLLKNKEDADVRYIQRVTSHSTMLTSSSIAKPSALNELTMKTTSDELYDAVLKGKRRSMTELVQKELNKGTSASRILDETLIPAINEVGTLFDAGTYFLPQLIASAEAMKIAIDRIEPLLAQGSETTDKGTIVIATVAGDIHDIGKNLVALMLKNYGYRIIDLGKDVSGELIIKTAKEEKADIIALSALMTTTMLEMKKVVELRNKEDISAKIIIGGAVITQSYCDEIGADGYSKDAQEAVKLVKRLLQYNN